MAEPANLPRIRVLMLLSQAGLGRKLAVAIALALLFGAVFGPSLAPFDPLATNPPSALQPPNGTHWFGTDHLGRDIFSRTVVATRIDMITAVIAVSLSLVLGSTLGAVAGWYGRWADLAAVRIIDTIMAFPLFVLAVGIAAVLGNSMTSVVIATTIVNLPFYARQVRNEVNRSKSAAYVEAARVAGIAPLKIVGLHIMPNLLAPLSVQSSLNMGWAILNAAGLSFIGLGIRPPQPEWGIMVAEGASYIFSGEWWIFAFPGAALMMAVLAFTIIGDALRDWLDPRRK